MRELFKNLWTSETAARAFLFSLAETAKFAWPAEVIVQAGAILVQGLAIGIASQSRHATVPIGPVQLQIAPKNPV